MWVVGIPEMRINQMAARGFSVDFEQGYVDEKQTVAGTCRECGKTAEMTVYRWKPLAKCPECGRALPAYHPCLEHKKA